MMHTTGEFGSSEKSSLKGLKMKDYSENYADRHKVERWIITDNEPRLAQGFYCTNGNQHGPDKANILIDGVSHPNPTYEFATDNPYYYFPEVGSSIGLAYTYDTEREALNAAIHNAAEEAAASQRHLDSLLARL